MKTLLLALAMLAAAPAYAGPLDKDTAACAAARANPTDANIEACTGDPVEL
jgi:hypothetical protein